MNRWLAMVLVLAAVVVGAAAVTGGLSMSASREAPDRSGLLPEVQVTAEMPRLVMPVVHVTASRAVASISSDAAVN